MKVKICGITRVKDALLAEKHGADIIGMIFAPSKRKITPARAKKICKSLKMSTMKAGVFVNAPADTVNSLASRLKLQVVQLSGDETPAYVNKIKKVKIIKAVRAATAREAASKISKYGRNIYAFLFDTPKQGVYGGSGRVFDWKILRRIKRPFFVAGGLNPGNVERAVKEASPFGVDASSGLEKSPGKKDPEKVKAFLKEVKIQK